MPVAASKVKPLLAVEVVASVGREAAASPHEYSIDLGYPAAKTARPWAPPSVNLIGRLAPALPPFSTGGFDRGARNPPKGQMIVTVAVSMAVEPRGSVTWTRI